MSDPLKIFEATFDKDTKQFEIKIFTTHLPYITFAQKLLDLEVTDRLLDTMKKEILDGKTGSGIVLPKLGLEI